MKFTFCPTCGTRAIQKEIGDEGQMPFCEKCSVPLWDYFTTSVICATVNEFGEVALIRQSYTSTTNFVCVAGHMKCGESAEETAEREVMEEIGQKACRVTFVHSYPYAKKDMLMLGFLVEVKKEDLALSGEVDSAQWFPLSEAPSVLREGSIAQQLVMDAAELLKNSALGEK